MTRRKGPGESSPQILTSAGFMTEYRLWGVFRFTLHQVYPIHWHEFYEIHFIVDGEGVNLLNGTEYPIQRGSLFLMTPADFHELRPVGANGLTIYNVIFEEEFLRDSARDLVLAGTDHLHGRCDGSLFQTVLREFDDIREEAEKMSLGYENMVHSGIERTLTRLCRLYYQDRACASGGRAVHAKGVHKVLAHMHRHFRDALTLADMAKLAGLSPNYFSEVFHQVTGESFQTYLQQLRLRFAKSLISTSHLPVTEVCYASGFNTLSHFERAFRLRYGRSPRAFRIQESEAGDEGV